MALTPEKKVKDKCVKLLKAYDVYYFFPATHGYGRSGVPDIICCITGKFVAIECKAGDNKPTAIQEKEMADIRNAKGIFSKAEYAVMNAQATRLFGKSFSEDITNNQFI